LAADEERAGAHVRYAKKLIADDFKGLAQERLREVVRDFGHTKAAAEARELLKKLDN
jgi:hypothetical protein